MRNKKGFTLIELMIAIAILGILMALGAPAMMQYLRNAKIRALAVEMKESLEQTKLEAIRRNNTASVSIYGSSGNSSNQNMLITVDGNSISTRTGTKGEAGLKIYKSVTARGSDTYTELTSLKYESMSFSGNGRISGTPFDLLITGSNGYSECNDDNACFKVVVSAGGSIRMCNKNLLKSNHAQGC